MREMTETRARRKSFVRGALLGALLGAVASLAALWSFGELTIRSAESPDGLHMAQVEMTRRFPFLVIDAHLTVRRVSNGDLVLKQLLTARDLYSEGPDQIHKVYWVDAHKVAVEMDSPNFTGRREFTISD